MLNIFETFSFCLYCYREKLERLRKGEFQIDKKIKKYGRPQKITIKVEKLPN